jgi:hypothetical protein
MTHCRTLKHVCNLFKVAEKEVRFRLTKKGLPLLVGSGNVWLDKWLDQKIRQESNNVDPNAVPCRSQNS